MDPGITGVVLVMGFIAGWVVRMIIARNRTLSDAVPVAGLAILQELALALVDGKVTVGELGKISAALITTMNTTRESEEK